MVTKHCLLFLMRQFSFLNPSDVRFMVSFCYALWSKTKKLLPIAFAGFVFCNLLHGQFALCSVYSISIFFFQYSIADRNVFWCVKECSLPRKLVPEYAECCKLSCVNRQCNHVVDMRRPWDAALKFMTHQLQGRNNKDMCIFSHRQLVFKCNL